MKTNKNRYRIELNIEFRKLLFRSEFEQFLIIHWQETYKNNHYIAKISRETEKILLAVVLVVVYEQKCKLSKQKHTKIHTHTYTH